MIATVAVPIKKDCLSAQFAICSHYAIYTISNSKIIKKELHTPESNQVGDYAEWFTKLKITDVVAYRIKPKILDAFIRNKINVFVGASQLSADELIQEYIKGNLKSNEEILKNK